MPRPPVSIAFATLLGCLAPILVVAAPGPKAATSPAPRIRSFDLGRRIDVNRINMFVTNFGSFGWDLTTGNPGLIYPKGSGKTALFAGGLWMGGNHSGDLRVTVAEYSQEYMPGPILPGGPPDDPFRPEHVVYKVLPWSGVTDDTAHVDDAEGGEVDPLRHHSWSEYMSGAVPYGAPWKMHRLPIVSTPDPTDSVEVPGPDVIGDQMLWSVYNDAEPTNHNSDAGGTLPLGIEVHQTTFAFDEPGALGSTVFIRYLVIHKGFQPVFDTYLAVWSDPDVGGAADDLAGCDVPLGLGYAYNATIPDAVYGNQPPAVGFDVLRAPGAGPFSAFNRYINGTDPNSAVESYNYMQGLMPDGSEFIDPTTGLPTRYTHSGDPLTGIGWVDGEPADRRIFAPSGPFTISPGDTVELLVALVIGLGHNHLGSIAALKCNDRDVQNAYDHGLARPFPAPLECPGAPLNCPRTADYWGHECVPGIQDLTDDQMGNVAGAVGVQATIFPWADQASFCATVSGGGNPRALAKREFAALLANVLAGQMGIAPPTGSPILLSPLTTVTCEGIEARTIAELIETAPETENLIDVVYQNFVIDHRRAIEGVNAGLPHFNGGAALGRDFFGSTLDPATQPDAFGNVEIRFSHAERQKAHRYLRLEVVGSGAIPPQGRGYLYAGFHDVNFTAWDVTHGVQVDVGFVERCFTDEAGNILPDDQQTAPTFDFTWGPDASDVGGREFLFVYNTVYDGQPKPELMVDESPILGTQPMLYAVWSRLRADFDVIDDGDRLDFLFGTVPSPGVDQDLLELESRPLSDPEVVAAYQRIGNCLWAINRGIGIGPICDEPTATTASLVSREIVDGRVRLTWHLGGAPMAAVERRVDDGPWSEVARIVASNELIVYEDADVVVGSRYGYRLAIDDGGTVVYAGETSVDLGAPRFELALEGARPNPSAGDLDVAFTLPHRGPGTLELIDVAGRRVVARDLSALEAGRHVERLTARRLPAGLYLVRLTHAGRALTTKAALVR